MPMSVGDMFEMNKVGGALARRAELGASDSESKRRTLPMEQMYYIGLCSEEKDHLLTSEPKQYSLI
jgi:hypothetical protein